MTLKDDMQAYQARWKAVDAIQKQEQRTASLELRWRQLNAIFAIAKALDWLQPDPSEAEVHQRWAMLKEKAAKQSQNP
jgi:hypothetical protein